MKKLYYYLKDIHILRFPGAILLVMAIIIGCADNQMSPTEPVQLQGKPILEKSSSAFGSKIAFVSNRDGNAEIYAMNADGTGQISLTNNPAGDFTPRWSFNGRKMAFCSNRDGNYEI